MIFVLLVGLETCTYRTCMGFSKFQNDLEIDDERI